MVDTRRNNWSECRAQSIYFSFDCRSIFASSSSFTLPYWDFVVLALVFFQISKAPIGAAGRSFHAT
jgi:hypothetical protein